MAANPQPTPEPNRSSIREIYKHDWYVRNREQVLAKTAKRKEAQRIYATPEQLEECRRDIRKAFTVVAPKMVCLECGCLTSLVGGPHLKRHGLTDDQYREKWGYNRRTALASPEHRQKLVRAARAAGGVRRMGGKQHSTPERTQKLIQARRAAPRRLEYRLDVGDSKRGSPRPDLSKRRDGRLVTDFMIAELRLGGRTVDEIAALVRRNRTSVIDRLHRIGFLPSKGFQRSRPCLFHHGEPMTGRHVLELCTDYSLTKRELAERLRVHPVWLSRITVGRHFFRTLSVKFAESILLMRRTLARERRRESPTPRGGNPYVLRQSAREALPAKYVSLLRDLQALRKWLRDGDGVMKMKQLYDWLCQAARRKGIETLLYWPQFFRWIKERYTDKGILDAEWRPSELALEFLADDYGASFETVRRIIRCSTGEI